MAKRRTLPDTAPASKEKRMTFFLPHEQFRNLRLQAGLAQVVNVKADPDSPELPEAPSALVREAVEFLLDELGMQGSGTRTDEEWEERLALFRKAMRQHG